MNFERQLERYSAQYSNCKKDLIASVVEFYRNFQGASPSCFSRELLSGHFTASGLVIRLGDCGVLETLLTQHATLNLWLQPGGHADDNPNLLEVATQEVLEETGLVCKWLLDGEIIDIDIHLIPRTCKVQEHHHFDVRYLFGADKSAEFVMSSESLSMEWVALDSIVENPKYDASLQMLVKKAISANVSP